MFVNQDQRLRLGNPVPKVLARTGLSARELCSLPADAVVFMSNRHWLRVPVGKLHNDRYVPLHVQLVELLEAHHAESDDDLDRLIVFDGRRLVRRRGVAPGSLESASH